MSRLKYFFQRLANQLAHRHLADSYVMRRLAQLSIYYMNRATERATKLGMQSGKFLGELSHAPRVAQALKSLQEKAKEIRSRGSGSRR